MAQPIYKLWMMKYKESWYKLTKAEQDKLMAQNEEVFKKVGGERIVTCTPLWASEEWLGWGVEKFPDIEAVQQHAMSLFNLNWYAYIESKSYLGTELPGG